MQSALRSCFELQASSGYARSFTACLSFFAEWPWAQKPISAAYELGRHQTGVIHTTGQVWQKAWTRYCLAASSDSFLLNARATSSPTSFFFHRELPRAYSVRPDISLSVFPSTLAERLRALGNEELSDESLRDIWRDILESFGDGEPGLPLVGDDADRIWTTLTSLGARDETVMHELCDYANRLWDRERRERPNFYVDVVGALMKAEKSSVAIWFHRELSRQVDIGTHDVLRLLRDGCLRDTGLPAFQQICCAVPDRNLHDDVVGYLCTSLRMEEALAMHDFLMDRNDFPKDPNLIWQLYIYVASQVPEKLKHFRKQLGKANVDMCDSSIIPVLMRAEGEPSKDSIPKLFAIPHLPIKYFFDALRIQRIQELDLLSFKELCIRVKTPEGLSSALAELDSIGVSVGNSMFVRTMKKAMRDGDGLLYSGMLMDTVLSQQHPAAFDNRNKMGRVFTRCHRQKKRVDLDTFMKIPFEDIGENYWYDLLLRDSLQRHRHMEDSHWKRASRVLTEMDEKKLKLTEATCHWLMRRPLCYERLGAYAGRIELVRFIASLWIHFQLSQWTPPAYYWNDILYFLGDTGNLILLERLLLWQVSQGYLRGRPGALKDEIIYQRSFQRQLPLDGNRSTHQTAFLERNLIEWGFVHAVDRPERLQEWTVGASLSWTSERTHRWLWGIRLLKQLRDQHNIVISDDMVADSFLGTIKAFMDDAFWNIQDPGRRWAITLRTVQRANEEWGKRLLPDTEVELGRKIFLGSPSDHDKLQRRLRSTPYLVAKLATESGNEIGEALFQDRATDDVDSENPAGSDG